MPSRLSATKQLRSAAPHHACRMDQRGLRLSAYGACQVVGCGGGSPRPTTALRLVALVKIAEWALQAAPRGEVGRADPSDWGQWVDRCAPPCPRGSVSSALRRLQFRRRRRRSTQLQPTHVTLPAPRGVAVVRSPPTGDRNVSAGSTQVAPPLRSNEAGEGLGSPAGAGGLWANNRASLAVLVDL